MPPNQFQWSMCNMQSKLVIKELLINALTLYVLLTVSPHSCPYSVFGLFALTLGQCL